MLGFNPTSDRHKVQLVVGQDSIQVKRCNLQFPAECPNCKSGVTSNGCFDCGYGLHTDSDRVFAPASGANLECKPPTCNNDEFHVPKTVSEGTCKTVSVLHVPSGPRNGADLTKKATSNADNLMQLEKMYIIVII